MRRLLFLMPILLCAAVSAHAQSLDAFKQRLAEPTPGATLFNRAQVTVTEHDDAARAVADALVVGSPVYYAGPNGSLCALLDRLFYSCSDRLAYKPAAAVAVCRRGGASATFDRLNKYFTISNMPVVSSQYWNSVHGRLPGEAAQDAEGLQTMRVLARNMARMLRAGLLASEGRPEPEERVVTSFIR